MVIANNPLSGSVKGSGLTTGLGAVNAALKEYYLPATRDILNSKRLLSRFIRQTTEDMQGKYAVISLNTSRNEGVGYAGEGGKLPMPKTQGYNVARYETRFNYGRLIITGPAASSSKGDKGAFLRLLDGEIQGLVRDIQHEDNRVLFGDGSGRLAQVNGAPSSAAVVVDNPGGFANPGKGTQYLRPGMRICSLAASGEAGTGIGVTPTFREMDGASAEVATVIGVDHSTSTVTFDRDPSAGNLGDGDYLYKANDTTGNTGLSISRGLEMFGLAAIVDDGNPPLVANGLGDIDATSNQWWQATVLDNGGTAVPFTPAMLQSAMDALDINGDGNVGVFVTTHGIRRQYVNLETAQRRYVGTMNFDGGFRAVEFDGRPMVVDKDCTRGRVYGLDREVLNIHQEQDWDWMDADGSFLHRLPDHDAYQATLYKYSQMTTWARNRNLVVKDIQDA